MKKNKNRRIQVRINEADYLYFQYLKDKNINISNHILSVIKTTTLYRHYYTMING